MKRPAMSNLSGPIERMLMLVAAALCVYAAWTWYSREADQARVEAVLETREPAGEGDEPPERVAAALKEINERSMFSPPSPEGFQGQVVGILGDKAFFSNQQSAGVGESVMGAEVLAIGPDWVEIEFEGDTRRLQIFSERGPNGGGGGPSAQSMRGMRGQGTRGMRGGGGGEGSRRGNGGVSQMSPEDLANLRARWRMRREGNGPSESTSDAPAEGSADRPASQPMPNGESQ